MPECRDDAFSAWDMTRGIEAVIRAEACAVTALGWPAARLPHPDHWYAWDIDLDWIAVVVGAGVFASAEGALREWRDAAGPAASVRRCRRVLRG